jgi:hypothetical protein
VARMEGEDIDRPALTPDAERHLDVDRPSQTPEPEDRRFNQGRVRLIDQAVELLAAPSQTKVDVGAERRRRANKRANGHAIELTPVDRRNEGPRHAGVAGDVALPTLEPNPQRAELAAEPNRVHE